MPIRRLAALLLLVLGGLMTRGAAAPASPGSVVGGWKLVAFKEANRDPVAIARPSRYTVRFHTGGEVFARLDCNRGNGTYTVSGREINVRALVTTKVRCAPNSHGSTFQHLLERASSYRFNRAGELVLSGNAGTLRLRPA